MFINGASGLKLQEGEGKYGVLVGLLTVLSATHRIIVAQSFITIHRTAAMARARSTTVPAMMPATYSLACCDSRYGWVAARRNNSAFLA